MRALTAAIGLLVLVGLVGWMGFDFAQFDRLYEPCGAAGGKVVKIDGSYECWSRTDRQVIKLTRSRGD